MARSTMKKLLVVDDDQAVRDYLMEILSGSGYQIYLARDGEEGLEVMRRDRPDLVLLDVHMPKLDGLQALTLIRDDPALAEIPIIFLTSVDQSHIKIRALEHGADDYLVKPFNPVELLARIKAVLRRTRTADNEKHPIEGELRYVSLDYVVQTFMMGHDFASLEVLEGQGRITVVRSVIVTARYGCHHGLEALIRLILLPEGRFVITFNEPNVPQESCHIPLDRALLDAAIRIDEIKRRLPDLSLDERLVFPKKISEIVIPPHLRRASMRTFLLEMDGEFLNLVELLKEAWNAGILKTSTHKES